MESFKFKYIDIESPYYEKAVNLRTRLFFKDIKDSSELINDTFEITGLHLVCVKDDKVVGTGRLNIEHDKAIISQMAIDKDYQQLGIGSEIVKALILKSKERGVKNIELSARETALAFYKKFGFVGVGELYPSQKTGVIHQNMELIIK